MPKVSVITPAYNAAEYLPAALNSVLTQTFSDWELIVVDDGSTDNTQAVVAALGERFDGRLKYFYQANRGLPAARNAAIEQSTGEYLALLDADDVWLPNRLERTVAELDRQQHVGIVHSQVARIDPTGRVIEKPPAPPAKYLSGSISRHLYHRRAHILCPTVLFRRTCLHSVGVFDEHMRATEDRDLWFRIARHFDVAYIPEVLAYYRISPSSMSRDFSRMLAAQIHFIHKHRATGAASAGDARASLGNIYRERGDYFFRAGQLGSSLYFYAKAVWEYPFNRSNCYMLLRALAQPAFGLLRPARPNR